MASEQLKVVIEMLRENPPLAGDSFEEMRAGMEAATAATFQPPPGVRFEPVDAAGVAAEWTSTPGADPTRAILYVHGGGYTIGSIQTHRGLVAALAAAAGARCLSVDYRLAPEHPHPAAVDDATTAYRWMLSQGLTPERTAVAGDSAGGGLTVATLVALRDAGDALPAAAAALSPWVDLACIGESMAERADQDPMLGRDGLLEMAAAYLGDLDPRTPLAAPLYAKLEGLPPLLIQVGTAETLFDDSTRLAEKARAAGVDVTLEEWEDMVHVFQAFVGILPEAQQAVDKIGAFLKKQWS